MPGHRLRLTLFLGLIVGPAGILTFLSLRAALDEQRSALADVRVRVPAIRAQLDARLARIVDDLATDPIQADASEHPEIMFRFSLDPQGHFTSPRVLHPALPDRSPAFSTAILRGQTLEFGERAPLRAAEAYRHAIIAAQSPGEQAEALNALGRVLLATRDTDGAFQTHQQLWDYPKTLDTDGAHPLTLSTLRLAQRIAVPSAATGRIQLIQEWTAAVIAQDIPLHPGTLLAVSQLRKSLWPFRAQEKLELLADLDRVARQAEFAMAYDHLLETAIVRPEATYLCCRGSTGADLLAAAHATESGGAVGVRIDLQALTDVILATDSGQALRDAGFEIALFGADETLEFEQRYGDDVRLVTTASNFVYRLNLGIYSRDQPFVFEHYRNRNALFVGGIGLLAATIGLGLWVVIRETTRELETARLRAEFVANVSHELRTPLTTIRMYAETLLLDRVSSDEERHEYLRTVMREAQRLSRMVGNILDFSRLESGRKDFDPIELDLGQVVRDTLDEFEPVFDEQHFEVAVDVDNDLPVIHADREALATAVANLVGNAVKYSSAEREIDIRVYAVKAEVCVDISDRGIGIPETERVVVFDKYRRASNVAGRATGTGLGLALVAGIVTSHRGSVEVLARDGGGTTVSMKFPIHKKLT